MAVFRELDVDVSTSDVFTAMCGPHDVVTMFHHYSFPLSTSGPADKFWMFWDLTAVMFHYTYLTIKSMKIVNKPDN